MPPTLKDGSGLSTSTEKLERGPENAGGNQAAKGAQAVALEVPVTVNGARAVEGSEKREPFSETTSTVLVKANGAVIRLAASVGPGQLLFLTNEKTKKEVVCQVVKSKNQRSLSGYVELEFTEPVLGFWGMRFPGDRHAVTPSGSTTADSGRKSDAAPLSGAAAIDKTADAKPTAYADARPAAASVTSNLADPVQEFKAEIKADSRPTSRADFLAPAESGAGGPALESNRLQEQLSALLLAEQKENDAKFGALSEPASNTEIGNAAAKILDMATQEPLPAKVEAPKREVSLPSPAVPKTAIPAVRSSFESEEVAIPSWLEPLARNATVQAPTTEEGTSDLEKPVEEWQGGAEKEPASLQMPAAPRQKSVSHAAAHVPAAPLFRNTLLGESSRKVMRPGTSSKGMWVGIAAALIVTAASGAWYFRESLGLPSSTSVTTSAPAVAQGPGSGERSSATLPSAAGTEAGSVASKRNAGSVSTETAAPSTLTQGKMESATITERIPKTSSSIEASSVPAKSVEVMEPEIKRPSLGTVRLAKPKVGRAAKGQANGETEPTLELSNETLSAENSLSTGFAESSKQPAAPAVPVVVGGDVTAARMISSVPPVYPALAKTQHVSGDVRIDALIDASGRVTTMKIVSGPSLLHQSAMDALRQWKYKAATLDGKPVAMHLTVTIQFRLQ